MQKIYFISGIDTGIGKTVATGLMARSLMASGVDAITVKLVQTGADAMDLTLRKAYKKLQPKTDVSDDCQVVELAGGSVKIVESFTPNFKVTTPDDLQLVSALLK